MQIDHELQEVLIVYDTWDDSLKRTTKTSESYAFDDFIGAFHDKFNGIWCPEGKPHEHDFGGLK